MSVKKNWYGRARHLAGQGARSLRPEVTRIVTVPVYALPGFKAKLAKLVADEVLLQLPATVTENLSIQDAIFLCEVQRRIFELDYYGESNFRLEESSLDYLWSRIVSVLQIRNEFVQVAREELERLRAYQEFEERIHHGEWPSVEEGCHALVYKSADIVLLKKLAMLLSGHSRLLADVEYHRAVAVAREIMDDLADIVEDRGTLNFNLFLAGPGSASVREVSGDLLRRYVKDSLPLVGTESWDSIFWSQRSVEWAQAAAGGMSSDEPPRGETNLFPQAPLVSYAALLPEGHGRRPAVEEASSLAAIRRTATPTSTSSAGPAPAN